jgi:hypothetical protein
MNAVPLLHLPFCGDVPNGTIGLGAILVRIRPDEEVVALWCGRRGRYFVGCLCQNQGGAYAAEMGRTGNKNQKEASNGIIPHPFFSKMESSSSSGAGSSNCAVLSPYFSNTQNRWVVTKTAPALQIRWQLYDRRRECTPS